MPKKVLAGGAFNILHPGHIFFLEKAKKLGDRLVVVVASDKKVRSRKNLLESAEYRAERIGVLSFVDKVVIGDDDDMMKIVREEKPDVIALGYDQDAEEIRKLLYSEGLFCRIVRIQKLKGYSTKKITGGKK
ncbi:MAG: adenylyltransferase/cytidyltransferase family protein [Candidatus Aenigmarchaeota archaeon]|nr:adenylyltransferase/cytidyltransferase family protein [Candidatus Aenigmarchaeota archaeon]